MNSTTWTVIGSIIVSLLALASAVWVALLQRKTTPYDVLSGRLGTLEKQVDLMRRRIYNLDNDLDVVVDALHEVAEWDGNPPPPTITQNALEIVRRRRNERVTEVLL